VFCGMGIVGFGSGKKVLWKSFPLLAFSFASWMTFFVIGSFTCRVGILDFPVSIGGAVISLLACHKSASSSPSSHSVQWSALVSRIISEYLLCCFRYSSCIGCCSLSWWYFDLPPSWRILLFSLASSFVHHRFEYGLGFVSLTCFLIVFCMASFNVLSLSLNSSVVSISVGWGMLARFAFSVFSSSVQSVSQKFHFGSHAILDVCMLSWVMIG
jgi:hypothetical protein